MDFPLYINHGGVKETINSTNFRLFYAIDYFIFVIDYTHLQRRVLQYNFPAFESDFKL